MSSVTVEPIGIRLELTGPDETVLAAARRCGLRWPSQCGGNASCGTCAVEVHPPATGLSPVAADEHERLTFVYGTASAPAGRTRRLACRLRLLDGDTVLTKRGIAVLGSNTPGAPRP